MSKVFLLSGVAGAGKSLVAHRLENECGATVFSADRFPRFHVTGRYVFVPEVIGEAHAWCIRQFTNFIIEGYDLEQSGGALVGNRIAVVDNTNTAIAEIAPYAAVAAAYRWDVEIFTMLVDPLEAWRRNVHGVPLTAVFEQHKRLLARDLPPWWNHTVVANDTMPQELLKLIVDAHQDTPPDLDGAS